MGGVGLAVTSGWRRPSHHSFRSPHGWKLVDFQKRNGTISSITIMKFEDEVGNECNARFEMGNQYSHQLRARSNG